MFINQNLGIKEVNYGTAIGSEFLPSGELLPSYTPIDGSVLGEVSETTSLELEEVLARSHAASLKWAQVPAPHRGELIRLIGERLRQFKKELGNLVSQEMGKSRAEGEGEVQEMIDMADFAVGQSRMLYGNNMHSERKNHRMYEQWQPLGVVGVISAFNFPVAVWAWNAFLAIICGNSVVWKPSPKTPLCAVAVHNICAQVLSEGDYPEVFGLITTTDLDLSLSFIDDRRIALVSFTGSSKVGREIALRVQGRFGRTLLELGGNNAVIVTQSADLVRSIPALVFAAIGTSGQRCTTLRRLIIHESIYDTVVSGLINAYKQLKIGNPLDSGIHMGPLIDADAVNNYLLAIEELERLGADIIYGGKPIATNGYFVEPTLVEAIPTWDIVNEETFAPILYLIKYSSLAEAIAINNQVAYGLSSAIFTSDIMESEEFLSSRGSDCGIANVNIGTSGAEIGGAFGGEKATGGGRESGSDAWKSYMRRQTVTINFGQELTLAQGITFNL